jgi:hypothetical protein
MNLKVYHAKEPNFREDEPREFSDANFELVALVECGQFEEVFYLTNHVDHPWWENEGVTCIKQGRSTSVGDVVVTSDGTKFLCRGAGWGVFE